MFDTSESWGQNASDKVSNYLVTLKNNSEMVFKGRDL